jgi:hypothetical protein
MTAFLAITDRSPLISLRKAICFAAASAWMVSSIQAETGDDYLADQSQSTAMINFRTAPVPAGESARKLAAVIDEAAGEKPLTLSLDGGKLLVFPKAGCYSFSRNGRTADFLRLWVNDAEPLRGAKVIQQDERHLVMGNTADGLEVRILFSLTDAGALEVRPAIRNPGSAAIPLRQLVTARGSYAKSFAAEDLKKIRYFREHYNIWSSHHPGHFELKERDIHSFYLGVLFSPEKGRSLTFAYTPNILWTSCVQAEGQPQALMAYTDFGKNPFNMTPGRKESFDILSISFNDGLVDALLDYGKQFKPRQPVNHEKMMADSGWNSWEFFKPSISEKNLTPVMATLSKLQRETGLFPSFIVDAGYYESYGKWVGSRTKFPNGMAAFAKQISAAGLRPGIWLSPAWVSPDVVKETGLPTFPHPNEAEKKTRIFDPSDPKANDYFLNQVKDLASAGYTYFKTDFLHTAYRIDRDYATSDYAPERVLRDYYQKIRDTIGKDAYWLACGSVPIPVVGICDASRTGPDVAANWERTRDGIETKLTPRFWMHGNLWWADDDFLVVAGEYTKPGQPIHGMKSKGTTKATGFTKIEAQTWANYLVVTGGMITWSDDPNTISDEGIQIVKNAFAHGSGNMGIPLDFEKTTMPAKWLRRESDRIYVGLFNWSDKQVTLTVSSKEISEIEGNKSGVDVLMNRPFAVKDGRMEVVLEPRASVCVEIKTSTRGSASAAK